MQRTCLLALALFLALLAPARGADDPEAAIRRFLDALLRADATALQASIVPCPDSALLLQGGPASDPDVGSLDVRQETPLLFQGEPVTGDAPVGTRGTWSAGFRGSLSVYQLELTADGWRVDPRYWIAMRKPEAEPDLTIRQFVFYLYARDREKLAALTTELPPLPGKPAFEDQYYALAQEMPVVPARPGDVLRLPGGSKVTVPDPTADHGWYTGQYGLFEIPFEVVRQDGVWKVVARDYLPWLDGL